MPGNSKHLQTLWLAPSLPRDRQGPQRSPSDSTRRAGCVCKRAREPRGSDRALSPVRMSWNSSSRLMDGNDRTRVRHSLYIPSMSPLAKRRALIVTDAMATHLVRALWLRAPCRERAALPELQDV